MIHPNVNPETAAVMGTAWPEHSEDAFRSDAESQRGMAVSADTGATAVSNARTQTETSLTGATGSTLNDRLGEDSFALGIAGERHATAADHLDAAAINIEEAKIAMNAVDAEYHTQAAELTARAAAEGWSPEEAAMARADLLAQAQQAIASIRSGFDGAYEGIVASLTEISGGGSPTMPAGTVEYPPPSATTTANDMGRTVGSATVDFTAGMLSGIAGQGGSAGAGSGVYAPGYGNMGAGYGVLAPGMGMNGMGMGMGMNGMGMNGMGMNGMGMGMNGMGMGMNGMGMGAQPSPLNQIGQAVGSLAQTALGGAQSVLGGAQSALGNAHAGFAGQSNLAGLSGAAAPTGLAALLQQNGLQGELAGAAGTSADLTTDLSSAMSSDEINQALADAIDAVVADPDGDGIPGDAADEQAGDDADEGDTSTDSDTDTGKSDASDEKDADTSESQDSAEADTEAGETDADVPEDKHEDGSIPARPVADSTPPMDPVTRLQTDVNQAVDGAADAARAALNTQVGLVTFGENGSLHADTIGLQGPQHIDAIRTETSSADFGGRDVGAAATPTSAAATPTMPYSAGAPMIPPVVGGPATPSAPVSAAAAPASSTQAGRHMFPEPGRLHRVDGATPIAPQSAAGSDAAANTTAPSFLSLLRDPVAGAHTHLALLRVQQFTNNAVNECAVGVFESGRTVTYVLATAHGLSYLPHDGSIPSDTRLLSELVDDQFYGHWCGYANPVTKLTDFAARDHTIGHLSYVLTSSEGVHVPGVEVVTQSLPDVKSLVESDLLAPSSRTRRDFVLDHDDDLVDAVRNMAMRTQVPSGDQYLYLFGRATGALWINDLDRAAYWEHWIQVLTADALRAVERGNVADAWFAVDEYRRVDRYMASLR